MNNSEITERNGTTTQMSEITENNHNWKCAANNGYLKSNSDAIEEQVRVDAMWKSGWNGLVDIFPGWAYIGVCNGDNGGANLRKWGENVFGY